MTTHELAYHYQIELTPLPAADNPRYESASARAERAKRHMRP